jgi:hypothetical protein
MWRFRYCERPERTGFSAQTKTKPDKYVQSSRFSSAIYVPPTPTNLRLLREPQGLGLVPEGEFKALVLADTVELALELELTFPYGLVPWVVAVGGVRSWKTPKRGCPILVDLETLFKPNTIVFEAFDNDQPPNPDVEVEERLLAQTILDLKCTPMRMSWSRLDQAKGIDDYLRSFPRSEQRVQALFDLIETATFFSTYSRIANLNKRFVYIRRGQKVVDYNNNVVMTSAEFKSSYLPGKVTLPKDMAKFIYTSQRGDPPPPTKEEKLAILWNDSVARMELDRFEFLPGQPRLTALAYNTWAGWGVSTPTDPPLAPYAGNVKPMLTYLEVVLARHTKEERKWLLQRLAWMFQHPQTQAHSWLNISGAPSSGKTGFVELLSRVVGEVYVSRPDGTALTGSFNYFLKEKILVSLDDTKLDPQKREQSISQFKKMVTESLHDVNEKHEKQSKEKSCPLFVWTGNDFSAIEADDRRCGVYEFVRPSWGAAEWRAWDAWRDDAANYPAILDYFLKLPLKDFVARAAPPRTSSRELAVEGGLSEIESFLYTIQKNEGRVMLEERTEERGPTGAYLRKPRAVELTIFATEDLLQIARDRVPQAAMHMYVRTLGAKLARFGFTKWADGRMVRLSPNSNPVRLWLGPTKHVKRLIDLPLEAARLEYLKFQKTCQGCVLLEVLTNVINLDDAKKKRKF